MKIIEAKITNFRALESVCVQLNQFSVIIGENDVGKTSLLFALEKFFTQKKLSDPKDWYKRQIENPIRMVLIFTELPVDVDLQPFIRADGSMVISGVFAIESPPEYNVILADQAPARISKVLLKKWFSLDSFHFIPVRRDLLVQFSMNKTALLGKLLRAKMNQALKDASASTSIGEIKEIKSTYIEDARKIIGNIENTPKIVIDNGGGAAKDFALNLLKNIGCDVEIINQELLDCSRGPDPTSDELTELISMSNNKEIGFAFDLDGDRLVVVRKGKKLSVWGIVISVIVIIVSILLTIYAYKAGLTNLQ